MKRTSTSSLLVDHFTIKFSSQALSLTYRTVSLTFNRLECNDIAFITFSPIRGLSSERCCTSSVQEDGREGRATARDSAQCESHQSADYVGTADFAWGFATLVSLFQVRGSEILQSTECKYNSSPLLSLMLHHASAELWYIMVSSTLPPGIGYHK